MKKLLVFLTASLISFGANAGLSVSLTPQVSTSNARAGATLGLSLDQRIFKSPYFVNAWVGAGQTPDDLEGVKNWGTLKLGVDRRTGNLSLGAGIVYNTQQNSFAEVTENFGKTNTQQLVYGKISYKFF